MRPISYLLILLLVGLAGACGVNKRVKTSRIQRHETGKRLIKIPRDSVVYKPNIVYKDTTIVVENKQVLLKTKYTQGKIIKVVCEQKPKAVEEHYNRDETVTTVDRYKERKGFTWHDKYLLWLMGFVLILTIVNKILNKML